MAFEVERKYRIEEVDDVRTKAEALGAVWAAPILQSDHYLAHPSRDFAVTDEALRVRRVGAANVITYKGPKIDRDSKTREEIEIAIGEGQATAQATVQLFERLGFRSVRTVTKSRSIAEISWQGREVEAALDDVQGAGLFIELETQAEAADLEAAKECIRSLAAALGLSDADQERRSYLEMVLKAFAADG